MEFEDYGFLASEYTEVFDCIEEQSIGNKIHKIDVNFNGEKEQIDSTFKAIKKVCISSIEWIAIKDWKTCNTKLIVNDMNKMSFKSLKVLEYYYYDNKSSMESVHNILKIDFDKLSQCKLYLIANFQPDDQDGNDCFLFATFCQRVYDLMMKHRIAIFIMLSMLKIPNKSKYDEYYEIYLSYFNQNRILNNYKPPQCNEYCVPLEKPQITFTCDVNNGRKWAMAKFVVKNATKSDNFKYQYLLGVE